MANETEALEALKVKTDAYISEVFDWVSTVGQVSLLQNLYDFKSAIDKEIEKHAKTPVQDTL